MIRHSLESPSSRGRNSQSRRGTIIGRQFSVAALMISCSTRSRLSDSMPVGTPSSRTPSTTVPPSVLAVLANTSASRAAGRVPSSPSSILRPRKATSFSSSVVSSPARMEAMRAGMSMIIVCDPMKASGSLTLMLASEVAAERCAGTEHEYCFVLIDVCLWVVDKRVADALLVRGETIQIRKRLLQSRMKSSASFKRLQRRI